MSTPYAQDPETGLKSLSVLYVEDDPDVREQLAQFLRRRVGRLYLADNGKAGLEAFHQHRPDIVVSDIRMPLMNGLEMASAIKREHPAAPVVITSAHNDTDYFMQAIDAGIDKYVLKPVNPEVLTEALQRLGSGLQARHALRLAGAVFEVASEGILITDPRRKIMAANPAFLRMTGRGAEELAGVSADGLYRPAAGQTAPPRCGEVRLQRKDGGCIEAWLSVDTVTSPDGTPTHLVYMLADISELKASQEALRRTNTALEERVQSRTAALEQANRDLHEAMHRLVQTEKQAALGRLVAGVAHELNTPIGNALTVASTVEGQTQAMCETLERGALRRSELDDYLASTARACQLLGRSPARGLELVSSFKGVAVDQASMRRRRFDLAAAVEELAATLRPTIKGTALRLTLDIPAGIDMDGYPGALAQVLTNMVQNALVHAFPQRDQAGEIQIAARTEGGSVLLRVHDDGVGIPETHAERIFEPFFTTRLGRGGSGLGLHIAFTLVTGVLGGRIELMRPKGRPGTEFLVTLPLRAPEQGKKAPPRGHRAN